MIAASARAMAAVVLVALLLVPPPRPWQRHPRMASLGVLRIRRARSK